MNFGSITLRQFSRVTNLSFKSKCRLLDNQQYILDNLWNCHNPQDKVKALNLVVH